MWYAETYCRYVLAYNSVAILNERMWRYDGAKISNIPYKVLNSAGLASLNGAAIS